MPISKVLNVPTKSILSYYFAVKHYCKLIIGEVNYLEYFKHLLPTSNQNNIKCTDNKDDYLKLKNKVKKKYFVKI